ncbi:hypothetical protein NH340_JMT00038 [Sarcoptes scabiei]|nr:hypothetical protein NH340_JMT00038 [Sarcoptes scabiei]
MNSRDETSVRLMTSGNYPTQLTQIKYQFYASKPIDIPKNSYELVVIGGGAGGLSTAARLKRYFKVIKKSPQSIAIIEPSDVG